MRADLEARRFKLASALGLRMTTLEKHPVLDVTVDGADEFDPNFQLIKGGGGALLLEKIVASSSRYMIVIADQSKQVETLGKFPLPVEVVPFGVNATAWKIERALRLLNLKGKLVLRLKDGKPFRTDNGNAIIDVALGAIPDPEPAVDVSQQHSGRGGGRPLHRHLRHHPDGHGRGREDVQEGVAQAA